MALFKSDMSMEFLFFVYAGLQLCLIATLMLGSGTDIHWIRVSL